MNHIESKVRSARRRLILGQFGRTLSITLFVALIVATLAITVPAFRSVDVDFSNWVKGWLIGSVTAAVLCSILYSIWKAPTTETVAAEVDRRFGLRERLSSAMQLPKQDEESDFGIALKADAGKRAEQLAVAERFSLKPNRLGWLPLAIVPVLAIVLMLVEPMSETSAKSTDQPDAVEATQVKTVAKQLKKRIQQQKRKADAQGLQGSQRDVREDGVRSRQARQ